MQPSDEGFWYFDKNGSSWVDLIRYGAFEIERIRELGNIWAGNELPKGSTVISNNRKYGPASEQFFCMRYRFPFLGLGYGRRDRRKIF